MRKSRIFEWILFIIIGIVIIASEGWFKELKDEEASVYVYAPEEMEDAFGRALKLAGLKNDYEIVMTDDISEANISVEMGKEYDSEYTKIAYSPFVVAYSKKDKNIKNMIENGVLQEAFFDDDYNEINFNKVIEEVIGEGRWENLGVKDMGNIMVYYPAPDSEYYTDYYDFMLVTVNGGVYPESESDLRNAMEQIERFENSNYTEGVKNFNEKFNRTGGFMENTLYLIPEQEATMLARDNGKYGRVFYPTTTVYANYYLKADEIGNELVAAFDTPGTFNGNFYNYIAAEAYRSDMKNMLKSFSNYLYEERDVYNVVQLDKNRIRFGALEASASL